MAKAKTPTSDLVKITTMATELGIYSSQLYGAIKRGSITEHLHEGARSVSRAEVLAWREGGSRRKARGSSPSGEASAPGPVRRSKARVGDVISRVKNPKGREGGRSNRSVEQVTEITEDAEGNQNIIFTRDTAGRELVWETDGLAAMLADGRAAIEDPSELLDMVVRQWVRDGESAKAASLGKWIEKNLS